MRYSEFLGGSRHSLIKSNSLGSIWVAQAGYTVVPAAETGICTGGSKIPVGVRHFHIVSRHVVKAVVSRVATPSSSP